MTAPQLTKNSKLHNTAGPNTLGPKLQQYIRTKVNKISTIHQLQDQNYWNFNNTL